MFSCLFSDPADADNLISGFSAFSKSSLYIYVNSMFIYILAMNLVFSDSVCFFTQQDNLLYHLFLCNFTLLFLYIKKSVSKCSFYLVCYIFMIMI